MGKRNIVPKTFREIDVPFERLEVDQSRLYEPFVQALMAHITNPAQTRRRSVPVQNVGIPAGFEAPAEHIAMMRPAFQEMRRTREETMQPIPVLERADGSLWAYDDAATIALYRELAPDATVLCDVIGKDPAR